MMVATFMGLLGATELVAPDLVRGVSWLSFGRIRPIHVNLVIFGFVGPGLFAAGFYIVPRMMRTPLFSEKLGLTTVAVWNAVLLAITGSLALGKTQGREYAEMIWIIDVFIVAGLLLMFFNLAMTVKNRKEPVLYVSVWYILAGVILTAVTYALGNVIWQPDTGALVGIPDAILLWFYGHNVFGLFMTPLAAAAA
ncbi:MAG: cytochrome-c oxidase, partial [Desulfobacteraceae bacterium]|nr:cytochrome-c oxidase [Desulfobacteraceae bacterium]